MIRSSSPLFATSSFRFNAIELLAISKARYGFFLDLAASGLKPTTGMRTQKSLQVRERAFPEV